MAFLNMLKAFESFEKEMQGMLNPEVFGICDCKTIEYAYSSILAFFSLYEWLVNSVAITYYETNKQLTYLEKLKILGVNKYQDKNKKWKHSYYSMYQYPEIVISIISKYDYESNTPPISALNYFIEEQKKYKDYKKIRNFITHGALNPTIKTKNGNVVIDEIALKKQLYFGVSINNIDTEKIKIKGISVNVNETIDIMYDISKLSINMCLSFWKACYGDKPYGDGWRLNRLDYVGLLFNSGIKPPKILLDLVEKDFPDSIKQTSPPSSSQ